MACNWWLRKNGGPEARSSSQAAASDGVPVLSFLAEDWDKARYPVTDNQLVLETKPAIPPDTNIQLFLDSELARGPSNVRTGKAQGFTIATAPAQFIDKLTCFDACDPGGAVQAA